MASTYVNDLRLNEMATGDQSGSWGTVTNTNLELIGEAFSYGTEAITTNADTHTTTIADGASDPGRAMFLKYTGTLDSACTITIGPNTVSKMWFIENATSGSQNIIISQGSGANVTIAAGQTKAVYSDGAGAGAAFVDAFAALNVAGVSPTELGVLDGITASTAELNIMDGVTATTAELNYNDITTLGVVQASKTVTADASGDVRFNDNDVLNFGTGGDMTLFHSGSDSFIRDVGTGDLKVQATSFWLQNAAGNKNAIRAVDGGEVILYHNSSAKITTASNGVTVTGNVAADSISLNDGDIAYFGTSNDLQIYHDGSNSYIKENGTGALTIQTNGTAIVLEQTDGENMVLANVNSDVKLYFDGVEKLATTTSGISVEGTAVTDGVTVDGTLDIEEVFEKVSTNTTTSGTYSEAVTSSGVFYLTNNQTANRTINFTGVNSALATGQSVTVSVLATQGSTAYYFNAYQVDSSAVTPKWSGGSAPTGGNASGIDVYTFTIIKTANATFTVLASQTQFA
jgi:hypothetical protein